MIQSPPPPPPAPARPTAPSGGGGGGGAKPIWTWTSAILLALNIAGLLLMWPMFAFFTPLFLRQYQQQGAALPMLTRWFVHFSHTWMIGTFCLALCAMLAAAQVLSRRKRVATWLNVAVGLLMGVFLAAWMVALALPMFTMFM